jgi:hypothetical protein
MSGKDRVSFSIRRSLRVLIVRSLPFLSLDFISIGLRWVNNVASCYSITGNLRTDGGEARIRMGKNASWELQDRKELWSMSINHGDKNPPTSVISAFQRKV